MHTRHPHSRVALTPIARDRIHALVRTGRHIVGRHRRQSIIQIMHNTRASLTHILLLPTNCSSRYNPPQWRHHTTQPLAGTHRRHTGTTFLTHSTPRFAPVLSHLFFFFFFPTLLPTYGCLLDTLPYLIALCVALLVHTSHHSRPRHRTPLNTPHTTTPPLQERMGSRDELKPSVISTRGDTYLSSI